MSRRKRTLFASVFVALLVVGGVTAGIISGRGTISEIVEEQPGDSRIVAIVDGIDTPYGKIRMGVDSTNIGAPPEWSQDEVLQRVLLYVIDNAVQYAEAQRRGLVASLDEARAYRDEVRELCYGPQGEPCREGIKQLGIPEEEYWENALDGIVENMSTVKMWQAVFAENGLSAATNEELIAFKDSYAKTLREKADIQWKDQELQDAFILANQLPRPRFGVESAGSGQNP